MCLICKQESDIEVLIDNLFTYDNAKSINENETNEQMKSDSEFPSNQSTSSKDESVIKCTNCDENNQADWFCTNCNEWLCEECKVAHTRVKLTKDHSILFKTAVKQQKLAEKQEKLSPNSKSNVQNVYCSLHLKEKLYLYCETCDQLTCRDCQLSSRHKEHKYKFINEAAAQQRQQFQLYLDKLKKRKKYLQGASYNIDLRIADINVKSNSTINDIKTISSNLIIELSKRTAYLIENLKFICNEKILNLNKKSNDLKQYFKKFNHCMNIIENAIKSNNETAILMSKRLIVNQLNNLLKEKCEVLNPSHQFQVQFINETTKINHLLAHIGYLIIDGKTFGKINHSNPLSSSSLATSTTTTVTNTNGNNAIISIKNNNGISPSNSPPSQQKQVSNSRKSVSPNPFTRISKYINSH